MTDRPSGRCSLPDPAGFPDPWRWGDNDPVLYCTLLCIVLCDVVSKKLQEAGELCHRTSRVKRQVVVPGLKVQEDCVTQRGESILFF